MTGAIAFTDVNLDDTHTASITGVTATGVISGMPSNATLLSLLTLGSLAEVSGTTPGSVAWNFAVPNGDFTYLSAGETVTLTYTVQLSDNHGGTTTQNVAVNITGTNDAPVIVSASTTATGAITEQNVASTTVDTANGVIVFNDVNVDDTHAISVSGVTASGVTSGAPSSATLLSLLTLGSVAEQVGATPGSVAWNFAVPNGDFSYLSAGQTVTLTYAVQLADNHGGTATQNVAVTITGTSSAPVTTVPGAQIARTSTATAITGISTSDATSGVTETVALSDKNGNLAVTAATGTTVTGSGSKTLTVSGTVAAVNSTLSSLNYTSATVGADTITLVTSVGALSNTTTIAETVSSTADHAPVIIPTSTIATGNVTELAAPAATSTLDKVSGSIGFTDADLTDKHTATAASVTATGVTTGMPSNATLLSLMTFGTAVEEVGATPGSVAWNFAVPNGDFAYLSAGETVTLTYAVQVADGHGGTVAQNVAVIVTGTNSAPSITAASTTATGAITDKATPGLTTLDTVTGSIAFADINLDDTHTASVTGVTATGATTHLPSNAALLSLLSIGKLTEQAGATPGSVVWSFSAPDNDFNYLSAGQTVTLTYAVQLADNHGGTISQNVAVTITGTNYTPTAAAHTGTTDNWTPITITAATLLAGASDPNLDDTLSISAVGGAVGGTVALVSGNAVFTPTQSNIGAASFTYTISDGHGGTSTATVNLTITKHVVAVTTSNSTLTASNAQVNLGNNVTGVTVNGTNDVVSLSTGSSASVVGNGNTINLAGGTVSATGNNVTFNVSGPVSISTNAANTGDIYNLNSSGYSFGAANATFNMLAGQTQTITGTAVIVNATAGGDTLSLGGSETVNAANDNLTFAAGSVATVTGSGNVISISGGTFTVTGNNEVINVSGAVSLGVSGTGETFNLGASGYNFNTTSSTYNLLAGQAQTINGAGNIINAANNDLITAVGTGETIKLGANDTITAGAGSDIFAIQSGFGHETINSFVATGTTHDTLQVSSSIFADWAHLLGATKQQGTDLLITLDANDTILLKNVALASFTSADAKFV